MTCPSPLGDTKICSFCVTQIRLTHEAGRLECYNKDGSAIQCYYTSAELGPLSIRSRPPPYKWQVSSWEDHLSFESTRGMAYAEDQRYGTWGNDAELFLYERWSCVAEFFNHHPRPYWVDPEDP